jgi:hypothetical protein
MVFSWSPNGGVCCSCCSELSEGNKFESEVNAMALKVLVDKAAGEHGALMRKSASKNADGNDECS